MSDPYSIPIIDFSVYSLGNTVENTDDLLPLSREVYNAFSGSGVCYLKNHGIPQETIDHVLSKSKEFFKLDSKTKMKYSRTPDSLAINVFHGYDGPESVSLNPARQTGDLKEVYNVHFQSAKWPEEVPELKTAFVEFRTVVAELALRILDCISFGFNKNDINAMRSYHNALNTPESPQCDQLLRTHYYPAVEKSDLKEGQTRCGEHKDYGTLTLLFQDNVGGLEVKADNGEYIPVTPIPGTVVLNMGRLMEMWTSDKLVAREHRVVIPDKQSLAQERLSLAGFFGTDLDTVLECLDGSNKYKPISARDFLSQMVKKAHSY